MSRLVVLALLLVSAATSARAQTPPQATVDRYCVTCHSTRLKTGGLALEGLQVAQAGQQPQTWEKVVRKVRTGMMPPANAPRPDRATLDALAASVETTLDRAAAASPNPGAPALHRLNRAEYANAIRDLLELPIDSTSLLPGDDSSEGFDNMASTLSVSPALMQAYVTAAAKISRLAIGDPTISTDLTTYQAPRGMSQATQREGLPLGTRGGILVTHVFPLDAEYEFRVGRAGVGFFGLPAVGVDDDVEITIDGQRVQTVGRTPPRGGIKLKVAAGPHVVGVAVIRKSNARGVDDLFAELANTAGVNSLGINGPINATGPGDTPSRRRIFVCRPAAAIDEVPCARRILSSLATRAMRRPVSEKDPAIDMLLGFYKSGHELRGFDAGIQYALARILVDPQFIYRF
jgi:cytochrome c551/c552